MNNWFSRIPREYWAYLALAFWGALVFMLLNKTIYGLDEGAAHALLLVWSVADGVVSSIVTLGLPDFRTLFFIPAGVLWTGNVLAAKLATMLVMAVAVWALYAWRLQANRHGASAAPEQESACAGLFPHPNPLPEGEETNESLRDFHANDAESSLLATGLLLISPLVLSQIDSMSVAPFLLFTVALGVWADKNYRDAKLAFGGMYFAQIFLCLVGITLHPVGFAYPLALLWTWYRDPIDKKHRNYLFTGIAAVIIIALALTSGWRHVEWFMNPIKALSDTLLGTDGDMGIVRWITGIGVLCILLWVILKQAANLWADMLGRILVLALVIGLLCGDQIFGVIALVICLYWGLPLLLSRPVNPQSGFWGQRGLALVVIFAVATTFMINDKARYLTMLTGELSQRDSLIKALAEDGGFFLKDEPVQDSQDKSGKKRLRVASQWPGLTMLACKCDALPLPPDARDSAALLAMLRGVDYLVFDPRNPDNSSLSHNLATMDAGLVETVDLKPGGVIVLVRKRAQTVK